MTLRKLKNKWFIWLAAIGIIFISLGTYNHYTKRAKDTKLSEDCRNKQWYPIPNLQFKNYPLSSNTNVIIKRKGQTLLNKIALKSTADHERVNYQLTAVNPDSALINKSDTLVITIGSEKHLICGFKSNTYVIDHDVLDCDEQYQIDSKYSGINEPNWINYKK